MKPISKTPGPPRWAYKLLERITAPDLREEVLGDMDELFYKRGTRLGYTRAWLLYLLDCFLLIHPRLWHKRPGKAYPSKIKKTNQYPQPFLLHPDMLRNYIKIALRNLWKSRGYAAINVAGLALAFCIGVFLFLTAYQHLTFDSFHADGDRIFKTYFFSNDPDKPAMDGSMPLPLAPALKMEYPELQAVTRVMTGRKSLVEADGKYYDKLINYTDPDFLNVFSFPLMSGSRETVLAELSSVVISNDMAIDLFGGVDPIGNSLRIGSGSDTKDYVITGVLADAPDNSTVRYDALVRMENLPGYQSGKEKWDGASHAVFLKLAPNVDKVAFEGRLRSFTRKYLPQPLAELRKKGAKADAQGDIFTVRLQPLSDIHFNREMSDSKGTPIVVIYVLLGMATFILLIACINFINLSIARSFTRAREVGVRKALGALKSSLFVQIWSESALICVIGFGTGTLLAYSLMPAFNAQFGSKLNMGMTFQPGFVVMILCVVALVTLLAGGYPARQMARFNTIEVLKGKVTTKRPGILRNSLIVTQFTLSCLLTCCTVIAFQQVGHLRQSPVGFDKEQVISIPVGNQVNGRQVLGLLRNKLAGDPSVLSISGSNVNLGKGKDRVTARGVIGFTYKGRAISTDWLLVDYDYLKTLDIKPVAGRDFDRQYAADSVNRIVITQSMAKMIGETDPVGLILGDDNDTTGVKSQIIGVIPDFQLYSVASEVKPITMHISHTEPINYIFVRVNQSSLAAAMDNLKKQWNQVAPQSEFIGSFLNENVDAWYQDEEQLSQVLSLASGVAIVLSAIGLFAIAMLMIEQRTKEIGIRKVMGSSIAGIVILLSRDFVKLVIIALCIAVPLAWWGMQLWLDNYSHRIIISPWIFITVGLAAISIALATVSFQTIKAALMNPVKSLKSE
jgi:putative ABC transport system permease protein